MPTLLTFSRAAVLAAPVSLLALAASAGGLAPTVETVAPTPVAPAPMMAPSSWTGFYAGGQLGYADLDIEDDEDFTGDLDFAGATYGVHVGYMQALGSVVLGAEFDYDLTSIEESISDLDDGVTFDVDSIMRLKLRLGYDAGNFLPYITGGVVRANVTVDGFGMSEEFEADGDFFGLGVAYRYSNSILIGAEVLQHTFDDGDLEAGESFDATSATARVSYKF